jgi:hypothetical protein
MTRIAMLLAVLAALFFAACGKGYSSPENIAEKYIKAMLASDYKTMKELSSSEHKKKIEKQEEMAASGGISQVFEFLKNYDLKAGEAEISEDGSTASVKVSFFDENGKPPPRSGGYIKVNLLREKSKWKVDE